MISADMTITQVLELDPATADIFVMSGLKRLGSLIANEESVEQAACGHGINLQELVNKLNSYLQSKVGA